MYPIKNAQWAIAQARGTENVIGWYVIREFKADPKLSDPTVVGEKMFIREGQRTRIARQQDLHGRRRAGTDHRQRQLTRA